MVVFNSVVLASIQAVLLFFNIKTLTNIKYVFRDYIAMICIIIPSTVLYYFFNEKATIFLLIAIVIFMYRRKQTIGVVAALISFFILYMANFISIWLATQLIEVITLNYIFSSFYAVSFILIAISLGYIIKYFFIKMSTSFLSLNKIYLSIVCLFLLTVLLLIYFYLPNSILSFSDIKFVVIMYAVVIITTAILIITISFSIIRQIQYKRNIKEIENYYKYTLQIEKINNEMRKFRHDYVNILST
ncbi:ATP-binding protein, partial [Staphylococcus cohnii]